MYKLPIPDREVYAVPTTLGVKPIVIDNIMHFDKSLVVCIKDNKNHFISLDESKYHLLGCVTDDTIDFDCEGLLIDEPSFRYALFAANVWFVNPYEKPERQRFFLEKEFLVVYDRWQAAQSKIVEKVVIIEKI